MFLRCVAPRAGAALVAAMSVAALWTASAPAQAAPPPLPCPASVVPGVPALPGAAGCWNAIAVQTARRANVFPIQGLIAVSAPQLAVYDAVTEIAGRYAPYHAFSPPPGTDVAVASIDASIAAAAHTTLLAAHPAPRGLPRAGRRPDGSRRTVRRLHRGTPCRRPARDRRRGGDR